MKAHRTGAMTSPPHPSADSSFKSASMGNLDLLSKAIETEESSQSITHSLMTKVPHDDSPDKPDGDKQQRTPTLVKRVLPISSPSKEDTGSEPDFCSPQHHQMVAMPSDFVPGPFDVLCGRGRACKTAAGNLAYRDAVLSSLPQYGAAESKMAKGAIISDIMQTVRFKCHEYHKNDVVGGFVKCVNGVWYEVGDFLAREKTSQCFRDALASNYSSSAQSKYLRRRAKEAEHIDPQNHSFSVRRAKETEHGSDHQNHSFTVRKTLDEVGLAWIVAIPHRVQTSNDENKLNHLSTDVELNRLLERQCILNMFRGLMCSS
jgi:hypothetical protein